jgi:hypothetical protein
MMSFSETFGMRIGKWVEQNLRGGPPERHRRVGEDPSRCRVSSKVIIESWETGQVVKL